VHVLVQSSQEWDHIVVHFGGTKILSVLSDFLVAAQVKKYDDHSYSKVSL
jgi:hypothetical protein